MSAEKFIIQGGKSLRGTVEVMGAKNAALPILAATLLTKESCVINNLPLIEDVFRMLKILEDLGAEISWLGQKKIKVNCSSINPLKIPFDIVGCFRGSILLLGPLVARFNKVKIPPPGGCLIGARPLDTHFDAFSQMGIKILSNPPKFCGPKFGRAKDNFYYFEKPTSTFQKKGSGKRISQKVVEGEVILREFSVTATENVLLFSALRSKETILKIADQDYQIQELTKVLKQMGAKIKGAGTHTIKIIGQKKLGGFNHSIMADPIEAGTFIVLALASQGDVLIKKAELSFLELFLKKLGDFGAKFEILGPKLIKVLPSKKLKMDRIQSLPYPGIHTDLLPELGVLATQTRGLTLIHDPLYEGRLKYLEELNKMGADIIFCDPHRAIINGPTLLHGIEISSPDIRAGAALIIAGLIAKGKTIIENIYQIDRGYERIEERLQQLGADIKRVAS